MTDQQKRAWRIGAVYALFGALWIVLSDRVLLLFVPDTADYSRLQTWKGWLFIAVTALLVTGLVRRALDRQAGLLRRALESEGRLRAIFDGVGDTILLLDPPTGRILEASAMLRLHWGYEPDELRGLGLGHLGAGMAPWTDAEAHDWIRHASEGDASDFQWLARRKDGSLFWVEIHLRRGDLGGQRVVLALVHDISERRAAEDALRASEERFSKAFHSRAMAMVISDNQGRLLHVNQAYCDLIGVVAEEVAGRRLDELEVLEDPEQLAEFGEIIQRDGRLTARELRLRRRDGDMRTTLCSTESFDLNGESCWLSVLVDISARREAEEALRTSEARLRAVTENAPAFISEVDREGRFLFLSRLQPGHRMEEVLGSTFDDWAPPDQRETMWRAFREAVSSGEPQEYEVLASGGENGPRWYSTRMAPVKVDGEVRRVVLVSQDITTRRAMEEALRRSEAHFRGLWEQASVGVALINARERRLESANLRFAELTGYSLDELTRLNLLQLVFPEDIEVDRMRMVQLAAGDIDDLQMEHRLRRKDGRTVWADITVSPLSEPGRPRETFIAVFHDVTARRQAERALRESEERYRLLFDSNPHAMWVFDRDSLAFLAVNETTVANYGWSRAEFLTMRVTDIRPPEDVPALLEILARHESGREEAGVWRHRRKNGEELLVEITSHRLDFALHHAELVLAVDVTAREAARRALLESETRLRMALEAAQQGIYDVDMLSGEGVVSPEYATMLGYPEDDLDWPVERRIAHLHPDDHEMALRTLREYPTGERSSHRMEMRVRTKEGGWKWVLSLGQVVERDGEGRPLRMMGTHTDITALKEAEQARGESELRLALAMAAGEQGLIDVDLVEDEGIISGEFMERLGYANATRRLSSAEFAELLHPDDHGVTFSQLGEYKAGARTEHRLEYRLRKARGGWIWVLSLGRLMEWDADGRPRRMVGTFTDITALREAQRARSESEERFRDIFDAIHEAIFVHDAESGRVVQVNRGMLNLYRCTEAEALAATPEQQSAGVVPWTAAEALEWIRKAREEGPQTFEWLARRHDGETFWAEVNLRLVEIGDQRRLIAMVRDISERKAADEARDELRQSEERHRRLFDRMALGSAVCEVIVDEDGLPVDYLHLEVNSAFEEMTGLTAAQVVGRRMLEIRPATDQGRVARLGRVALEGGMDVLEFDSGDPPRHFHMVVYSPRRGQFATIVQDVTRQRRLARRLELLREIDTAIMAGGPLDQSVRLMLRKLREIVPCQRISVCLSEGEGEGGVCRTWLVEGQDGLPMQAGSLHQVPEAVVEKYRRGESISHSASAGEAPRLTAHRELAAHGLREFLHLPLNVQGDWLGTLNLARKGDEPFDEDERQGAAEVAALLAIAVRQQRMSDELVAQARLLECRVAERTAELEASNRELDAFAYSVSHDLRAPLRAIDGFARLLEEEQGGGLDAEGLRRLAVIRDSAARMKRLISDLLALSRVSRSGLVLERVEMGRLAREVLDELVRDGRGEGFELELGALPPAFCDAGLLRQVWTNLLDNALKFGRECGRRRVEVSGESLDGEIVYSLKDFGAGFDPALSSRLFDVFQRLPGSERFEGTGVGLALVQRIVQRHGGRVWAESVPGQGASFRFSLPDTPAPERGESCR